MIEKVEKKLKMDDYDLEAVFTPTVINLLIAAFFIICTLKDTLLTAEATIWWQTAVVIVTPIAVEVILFRFFMQTFRESSKLFESVLYRKDRLNFPTTSMLLLGDNSISQLQKKRIRQVLKSKYNINLPSKAKEEANEMEVRRTVKDTVALIRKEVADSGDTMTRRKLKRYGTFRNFLGGALYCFPVCLACWLVSLCLSSSSVLALSIALAIYFVYSIVDFFLVKNTAVEYAESLITTFDKNNYDEA